MIHPYKNPETKPQIANAQTGTFLFAINPEIIPTIPRANICHGVHAPCPKYMLDAKAIIVPIKNPVSGPLTRAPMIKMNNSGFNDENAARKIRPATAKAQIIAIKTTSREFFPERSNRQK